MKKKALVVSFAVLACVLILASAVSSYRKKKRDESRAADLSTLAAPDSIRLEYGGASLTLFSGDPDYTVLHSLVSDCWNNSLIDGHLEFFLLTHAEVPTEDTLTLIYQYDDPIPWQRYGTDGVTIQADTYTFFPFYAPNSDQAIISRGQTYAKEAYVVRFHASSQLKETLQKVWRERS